HGNLHEWVNKIHVELDEAQKAIDSTAYFHRIVKSKCARNMIEMADYMVCNVTDDEVKCAIFSMGDDRASGPDGFTVAFFKKAWDVVGGDITCAI
nr:hypothetical protein [Tanacetum cinerariifolium]